MNARELLDAATARPWTMAGDDIVGDNEQCYVVETFGPNDADTKLILAAVNEYEALLDVADAAFNAVILEADPSKTDEQNTVIAKRARALRDALAKLDAVRYAK